MLHVSVGILLSRVYPNDKVDNFLLYEQLLISVIWIVLTNHVLLFQEIHDGHRNEILRLVAHISVILQIVFELTVPLYVIYLYGYPDVATELTSAISNTSNSVSGLNESTRKSSSSKRTGESVEYTLRSQLGIEEIMSDQHFRDLFSKYLGREFQTEIFLFFDVLQFYKEAVAQNKSMTFAIEDAKLIIEEFIAENAINKLPIAAATRQRIIDDFSKLGDVENPLDVANIFQPAIDYLNVELSFHLFKFNANV